MQGDRLALVHRCDAAGPGPRRRSVVWRFAASTKTSRGVGAGSAVGDQAEGGDDDQVAHRGASRRRAVERDDATAAFGTDRVGDEALAIGDVPDVHLLVLADVGRIEQVVVDRARAFVMQLAVRDRGTVDLGLEQVAVHDGAVSAGPQARAVER